jgi:hypothetical protein
VHAERREPVTERILRSETLGAEDIALIGGADTFFLGTVHPSRGADASHRGGTPGFVRVEGGQLWWPDYRGNNMFNSFGNLEVDKTAALLFVDFEKSARACTSPERRLSNGTTRAAAETMAAPGAECDSRSNRWLPDTGWVFAATRLTHRPTIRRRPEAYLRRCRLRYATMTAQSVISERQ